MDQRDIAGFERGRGRHAIAHAYLFHAAEIKSRQKYASAPTITRVGQPFAASARLITGVPVAVIDTPSVRRLGAKAGPLARWMLRGRRTKHWMRTIYALRSLWALKRGLLRDSPERDYWQAGKSVAGIDRIEPAGEIVRRFAGAWRVSAAS